MKIFLDVGAHTGQTLAAALRYPFDRIVCFEPVISNHKHLRLIEDARVVIEPFGLWDHSAEAPLYNVGTQGASLWKRPGRPETEEMCAFVRASDWIRDNVKAGDTVWMKLNVEGAELDVLTDLLDSGQLERITYTLVMWDANKIPQISDRLPGVRDRVFANYGPPRVTSSKSLIPAPTHTGRIDSWLLTTGLPTPPEPSG